MEYEEHKDATALSLKQAIQTVTAQDEGGRTVYEITLASDNSGSREFTVDALSGKVTEGKEESE
jgi:hypothetical protein